MHAGGLTPVPQTDSKKEVESFVMQTKYAQTMAAYNRWMNDKLYAVCARLPDSERKADRGAYFHSIHGTLNHLLLADQVWLGRFTGTPFEVRRLDQELHADFDSLSRARAALDRAIETWAGTLTPELLEGILEYTSISGLERRTQEYWFCVAHFFNHQTHHRGQLTTLLSQAGLDVGVTDLIALPAA